MSCHSNFVAFSWSSFGKASDPTPKKSETKPRWPYSPDFLKYCLARRGIHTAFENLRRRMFCISNQFWSILFTVTGQLGQLDVESIRAEFYVFAPGNRSVCSHMDTTKEARIISGAKHPPCRPYRKGRLPRGSVRIPEPEAKAIARFNLVTLFTIPPAWELCLS